MLWPASEAGAWEIAARGKNGEAERDAADVKQKAARKAEQIAGRRS
jgi:hypothetical protein